jgi:hypothetical protein
MYRRSIYVCSFGLSATGQQYFSLKTNQSPAVFSQNKSATSNHPAVLFSQNKSAPAISHQPNEHADSISFSFGKKTHTLFRASQHTKF